MTTNSHILEYIALGSCLIHSLVMLLNMDMDIEPKLLFYFFIFLNLLLNNSIRGTRLHLYPLSLGFALWSLTFLFGIFEQWALYLYLLLCVLSLSLTSVFGSVDQYQQFETSGRYRTGCVEAESKATGNRLLIYYPTPKRADKAYPDMRWAYDGEHTVKGLMKFGADMVPAGPFKYLQSAKQNVRVRAPLAQVGQKYVPIVFSHGVGNTMTWFSTICKDLSSQGHIVFCVEHNDRTALHTYDEKGNHKYFKNVDMRNVNEMVKKLGVRMKEIDCLLSELQTLTKNHLGSEVDLDLDNLTLMGHGFGATTAIVMAAKDQRVKKLVTYDPWLMPIEEEILNNTILVSQPHCSVNSELFHANMASNWSLLVRLFRHNA